MVSGAESVLTYPERIVFFFILLVVTGLALRTLYRRYSLIGRGRPGSLVTEPDEGRLKRLILYVPGQWCNIKNISRNDLAGIQHLILFWGVTLFSVYYLLFVVIGDGLGLLDLLRENPAARIFLEVTEIFGLLILVALAWGLGRRILLKPARLGPDFEGGTFFFIALSGYVLIICFFVLEGVRFHLGMTSYAGPLSGPLSEWFGALSVGRDQLSRTFHTVWWIQALFVAGFIVYVPFSNHQHALFSPFNISASHPQPKGRIAPINLDETYRGLSGLKDFTRKQFLEFYGCTQCGRCQEVCPAYAAGKPLSPKKVIQELRVWMDGEGGIRPFWKRGKGSGEIGIESPGLRISDEELWACTTCMACVESCPAFISSLDKIIDLRRDRVLMRSRFFPEVNNLFRDLENFGDAFGKGMALREDWVLGRNIKILSEENETEVLFWAGCQASFHDRNKAVAIHLIELLSRCGVDLAILGKGEICCGDPLRRLGNEYQFQSFAHRNIDFLKKLRFKTVVTYCPHCFNTLKNEYPQFGGHFEVRHYTELLDEMIRSGAMELNKTISARVAFHDPCYLARGNDVSTAREILSALPGVSSPVVEHSAEKTFCCGGGGGHMWMREIGGARINELRVKELVQEEPDVIATSCPYCLVMLEDGIKSLGLETVKCRDLIEIVREMV